MRASFALDRNDHPASNGRIHGTADGTTTLCGKRASVIDNHAEVESPFELTCPKCRIAMSGRE